MDSVGPDKDSREGQDPERHPPGLPPQRRVRRGWLRVGLQDVVPAAWMKAVVERLQMNRAELEAHRAELDRTRVDLDQMTEKLADLDRRIASLYGAVNRLRADLSDERDAEHHDCAQRFRLLCQRLVSICGNAVSGVQPDPMLRPSQQARVTGTVARALFGPLPPEPYEVHEAIAVHGDFAPVHLEPLRDLCVDVAGLRADVARLGGAHRWDFEVGRGRVVTKDEFELWYSCSPEAPIAYVVTPAYLVVGRPPYERACVYTAE